MLQRYTPNSENQLLAKSSLQPRGLLGAVSSSTAADEGNIIKSIGIHKTPEPFAGLICIRSMLWGRLTPLNTFMK